MSAQIAKRRRQPPATTPELSIDDLYFELKAVHERLVGLGRVLTYTEVTESTDFDEINSAFRGTGQSILQECRHLEIVSPILSEYAVLFDKRRI